MELSRFIPWFFIALMISCAAPKHATDPSNKEVKTEDSPRILFLNYEIARDTSTSTFTARLINKVAVAGKIKSESAPAIRAVKGDLELQMLDRNQKPLNTLYIPNPLNKVVEFVNDRGELQKKTISLDVAEFSVRLQLEPDAATILLYRITGSDSESIILLKTHIQ